MQWFHCDPESKEIIAYGTAGDKDAFLQPNPNNYTLYVLPDGSVQRANAAEPDMSNIKELLLRFNSDPETRTAISSAANLVDLMVTVNYQNKQS